MEHDVLLNEPNAVLNTPNEIRNEPNGLQYRTRNTEVTTNTLRSENMNTILLKILNELKQTHSATGDNLKRKENEDWLTFAAYLDKVFFVVFMVLFIIILIVLIILLML